MDDSSEKRLLKTGLSPGTLIYTGEKPQENITISIIDYSKESAQQSSIESIKDVLLYKGSDTVTWVNIDGIHDVETIEEIGNQFKIHPLVLEDILHSQQRPKIEEYDDYLFVVLKNLSLDEAEINVQYEQISIIMMEGLVFTFTQKPGDLFSSIHKRIISGKGSVRQRGADYLLYTIIDSIVDRYFVFEDSLDNVIEIVEDQLLTNPDNQTLSDIQRIKREIIFVKKSVSPVREMLAALLRSNSRLIHESTDIYYRDVYDHAIRVIDAMESYRDLISGMLDIYLSSVSNKMNEIMKVLTIFASIFIPLTFIAGIYGMNFEYMPELKWKLAYPVLWVVFIGVTGLLLFYFKRKKWL